MNRRDVLCASGALLGLLRSMTPLSFPTASAVHIATRQMPFFLQPDTTMFLIRDVFRCKPGRARQVAEMFKQAIPSMEQDDGFRNCRVMVDYVASYWTVVLQAEVGDISQFDQHMQIFGTRPEVQQALAGYMDLVEGGHREIYRML